MKYVIVLGDGMADEPVEQLGGRTPLAAARTPVMDALAAQSEIGMTQTIPKGMKPGSDTANLAVLGYDPAIYYSGRSPLEALSIGIEMEPSDIAIRCNIVTISENPDLPFEEQTILDHSSGEISTEDCAVLLEAVRKELEDETYRFYVGTSYRHCLIWKGGSVLDLTAPHDVLGQRIGEHLPQDAHLLAMMRRSYEILKDHPLNRARKEQGLNPANCCWFWGAGTKPSLASFTEKTGKRGVMISAVDLLKGIAAGSKMTVINVPGANGGLHTNYEGKADAAFDALTKDGYDFAYIHVEAPDEMGHQGSAEKKIQAIEYLDERVIGRLKQKLDEAGVEYRMMVMPDHPTPVAKRTHTDKPIPYLLYDSAHPQEHTWKYNEAEAEASGNFFPEGSRLIEKLFSV
ncbi:MAG: cofactor-independent phosphoglycerate mutase [Eubacteriales bacterium]|nr:cofactor-independent phosphoglycerate mutase [Eubacteriales bacterium]